ncbi:sensor histidine kinase [Hymenobacter terrenus]|uniref:sensor histidine kinase n=1 Tax=Hymenobacter terrenus TaxID=1629124 RepID=UPI0006985BA2|nr:sensor histidine kinase [Hymenobacter terrenus]
MKISDLGRRVLRHVGGWLLFWALFCLVLWQSQLSIGVAMRFSAGITLVNILVAYAHFYLLDRFFALRRYGFYAVGLVLTVLGGGTLAYFWFAHAFGDHTSFVQSVVNTGSLLAMSTTARYLRRGVLTQQELRARQLETELSLLKAQVNQHFLFNTLNNLYGLSLAAPDQIPEALLQLADLMRYQLDSSRQSTVTVGTEAEYLANYIGLEKLRLRANTQVEFTVDLPRPEQPLAPLLLLPLVENCFKHAIGPAGVNTIRIHLAQTAAGLILRTDNSIPPSFRPAPSGLGLPNLRTRLAQFYPAPRHQLVVESTPAHYAATLFLAP